MPFYKMTGSGNDFVFFDGRVVPSSFVTEPEVIQAICNRHNGIGADGLVVLEPGDDRRLGSTGEDLSDRVTARILYFNSDGSPADLCGNATLCSTALSVELGMGHADGVGLSTPSGRIAGRVVGGIPEISLPPVREVNGAAAIDLIAGETRVGFAIAGIPHLVVLCDDADAVRVDVRGPALRWHPAAGETGANVNWVSRRPDGRWRYRTFERGVEGETQACGTGAVATAVLLSTWGLSGEACRLMTSSGRGLDVTLATTDTVWWRASLKGEGRVVFRGIIGDLFP